MLFESSKVNYIDKAFVLTPLLLYSLKTNNKQSNGHILKEILT